LLFSKNTLKGVNRDKPFSFRSTPSVMIHAAASDSHAAALLDPKAEF
jgi:hypothetical protein